MNSGTILSSASTFRRVLPFVLFLLFSHPVFSQFYEIYGETQITCSIGLYQIESEVPLAGTEWDVEPNDNVNIIYSDPYTLEIEFLAPGFYTITATSIAADGSTLSLWDFINVSVSGVIISPEIIGCTVPDSLTGCFYVCAFSHTILEYPQWAHVEILEITGAEDYTLNPFTSIDILWGAGGSGSVTTYAGSCASQLCFEILPEPVADFVTQFPSHADTITVCRDQVIYFDNKSFNALSYLWNFGDGSQSSDYDFFHTYSNEGFYTVTLTAESICECSDVKQIVVEVLTEPAPTLDCVNSVCPETRQRYTAVTDGCTQFSWSVSANGTIVNGGEVSDDFIEVIWHEGPDGFIELSVSGCQSAYCAYSNRFRIPIISPDGPIEGDVKVCSGEITTYTAPYFPGTIYQWQVGPNGSILGDQNLNAVTIKWNTVTIPTASFVEVSYDNCFLGCGGTDVLPVTIATEVRLSGDAIVCENAEAQINAHGIDPLVPIVVSWHIENALGQIVYSHPGTTTGITHAFNYPPGNYSWVATQSSPAYCTDTIRHSIEVIANPATPLSIRGEREICPGKPYGFSVESAGTFGTVWTITDGSNVVNYEGQSCEHVFGPVPPYIVEARHVHIQYQSCTSDPISIMLTVPVNLTIEGPDEVCFNAIESFSTKYINGADYVWEIIPPEYGEIRKSDLNDVEIFWTQSGSAIIRLTACGVSTDKPILIHTLPVFNIIGPMEACENETVDISLDQPFLHIQWKDADDNVIGTLSNVQLSPGAYAVEVTDFNTCMTRKSFEISSYPSPLVHLSSPDDQFFCNLIPAGVEITVNTDGTDYTFVWYKDDIEVGPGGPIFTVFDFGAYHVAVTNQYGCVTISEKIVFFNCCAPAQCDSPGGGSFPVACVFYPHDFQVGVTKVTCNNHRMFPMLPSVIPGDTRWIVRSCSKGYLAIRDVDTLDYTYALPGYYQIEVLSRITGFPYGANDCGHYQRLKDTVYAVAHFKHEGQCAGAPVSFEDLTTYLPGQSIASWVWDFGDPSSGAANTSMLQNPTHAYAMGGTYEVTLTVSMVSGCITTRKHQVSISPGPVLTPVYENVFCENEALAFYLPGQLFEIDWSFGDVASGVQNVAFSDSAFHTYALPDLYTVHVEASDIYQCRSQLDFAVDIKDNVLTGDIAIDPASTLCYGDTAILTAPAGGVQWSWGTGETSESILATTGDQYSLFMTDQYHCSYAPPPVLITMDPKPEILIQAREILGMGEYGPWSASLGLCYGTEFQIQVFSSVNVLFEWSHGPVTDILSFTNEAGNLPSPGIHTFEVIGVDPVNKCRSDTEQITIEIYENPNIPVIMLSSGSGCGFDQNVLRVMNPQAGVDYFWSDGQEGIIITVSKSGVYSVTAINVHGCSTQSSGIHIKPPTPVDQIPAGCFIACDPLTVCLPLVSNVSSYVIYQNGNVFQTGTSWPQDFLITEDGSYTIEITTSNGCTVISDPLDIMLYIGTGSITVITYEDLDGDGMIGPGDAILPGIAVQIISDDGLHLGQTYTDTDANFVFEDYPSAEYTALIDQLLLSSEWEILIDSVQTQITTCGDSVIVSLLLTRNCVVTGPDQEFEMCPGELLMLGDSTWSDTGVYVMHLNSIAGCDSMFQVIITAPDSMQIEGFVWLDVDQNGVISPADTLVGGIPVQLLNLSTGSLDNVTTSGSGTVNGFYPTDGFDVWIDTALLAENYTPVIYQTQIADTACGATEFHFLVASVCPSVFVIENYQLCPGDSILIQDQWLSEAGQYEFMITGLTTLCDTILDVYVSIWEEMVVESMVDWNCQTLGSILLNVVGDGPLLYDWSHELEGDTLIENLEEGLYHVGITDVHGCVRSDAFSIVASPGFVFDVVDEYVVTQGDSVLIPIEGDVDEIGLIIDWSPPGIAGCPICPASWVYPLTDTTLTIQITDADSCVYVLQTTIIVEGDSIFMDDIYVPNVFSPNGDGINDLWKPVSRLETTFVHQLSLFDRWGNTVFSEQSFLLNTFAGWDGTAKGKPMNPGVVVFVAEVTLGHGERATLKGDVTLLR